MTDEQNIIYIQGLILQARIKMEGMIAQNQIYILKGEYPVYDQNDFDNLIIEFGIHETGLIKGLREE